MCVGFGAEIESKYAVAGDHGDGASQYQVQVQNAPPNARRLAARTKHLHEIQGKKMSAHFDFFCSFPPSFLLKKS